MLRAEKINIVLLICVKLALTLPFINAFPIDLDEPFSIFHAQKSLPELFDLFQAENNPPLHFIILHFWEKIFGIGPLSVRSLSLLFSVLTIPVLFLLARIFLTRIPAYTVVLLFLFSDFHHYHSIEARTYSLFVLLFTLTTLVISRILIENKKELKYFIYLGVLNVLLFYTHYISIFVFITELVLLLLFIKELKAKKVIIALLITIIAVLPWIGILFTRTSTITSGGTWVPEAEFTELYGLINKFLNDRIVIAVLVLSSILTIYFSRKTISKFIAVNHSRILVLAILFTVPYLTSFVLSVTTELHFFYDRYLFFLTIPLFILIVGLFDDHSIHSKILFIPFIIVYLTYFNVAPVNNRDGDELAKYVKSQNGDKIIIAPGYYQLTFLYHFDKRSFENIKSVEHGDIDKVTALASGSTIQQTILPEGRIILINAGLNFVEPTNDLEKDLSQYRKKIAQKNFKGNYTVTVWE